MLKLFVTIDPYRFLMIFHVNDLLIILLGF